MDDDCIVEIYAAANSSEAHVLCDRLIDAGIRATVVGDDINVVAGSAPFGGVASPRIWVREQDKDEATRLLHGWLAETRSAKEGTMALSDDDQGQSSKDEEDIVEDDDGDGIPDEGAASTFVGKALVCFGVVCILLGAVHAWNNYRAAQKFTATTEAKLQKIDAVMEHATAGVVDSYYSAKSVTQVHYDATYQYEVDGTRYRALLNNLANEQNASPTLLVYYDPHDPRSYVLDSLVSPWLSLLTGMAIGGALLFVTFRMQWSQQPTSPP